MTRTPRNVHSAHPVRAAALGFAAGSGAGTTGLVLLGRAALAVVDAWSLAAVPVPEGILLVVSGVAGLLLLVLGWLLCLGALTVRPAGAGSVTRWAVASAPRLAPRVGALLLALTLSAPAAHATPAAPRATLTSTVSAGAGAQSVDPQGRGSGVRIESAEPDDPEPKHSQGPGADGTSRPSTVPLPGWGATPAPRSVTDRPVTETGTTAPATTATARPGGSARSGADGASGSTPSQVVVRRGDSLWSIAARSLGPGATAADIAQEWPRWYAANRLTIGPDPDLILPGHILVPPTSSGEQP